MADPNTRIPVDRDHPPIVCRSMAFYYDRRAQVADTSKDERDRCVAMAAHWRERAAAAEAAPPEPVYQYPGRESRTELINAIVRAVCELPDRTSPEDQPDTVTLDVNELIDILEMHL